ncbi:MAG: DUF547 domain-containing protein, partial [Bacteriovoracaceae bacterium]
MKVLLVFLFFAAQGFAAFDQSHSKWQEFLKKRIKKEGNQTLVNYGAVKKDYEKLKSYLLELENVSQEEFEKFEKDEKLAFWINAYNAYTLDIVARHYP